MTISSKVIYLCAVSAVALSGCSAAQVRGTPAQTAQECQEDWGQETRAAKSGSLTSTASAGAFLATVFVSAVATTSAKSAANDRYRACMARIGVALPADRDINVPENPAQSLPVAPVAGCPIGARGMYAGTLYCGIE
jgi:hypothetical protein